MKQIGFLGFGQMATAILDGFLASGAGEKYRFGASAAHYEKLKENAEKRGIQAYADNAALIADSDILIVAVKPYLVRTLLEPLRNQLYGKVLVSIAAGLTLADFQAFLPEEVHVLSTLPNTPMAVGKGVLILEEESTLTEAERAEVEALFSPIATLVTLPVAQKGIAGTLSGCGPAFADLFIEALGDAGVKYGLPRKLAYQVVAAMLEGAAHLQLESGVHPGELKDRVTSPGGTTIRGISALERWGFRNALIQAIDAIEGPAEDH